jgi:hypothetical protein
LKIKNWELGVESLENLAFVMFLGATERGRVNIIFGKVLQIKKNIYKG